MRRSHKGLKLLGLASVLALAVFGLANFAQAEQAMRIVYHNTDEINHAVMNSIVDNPEWGDERDFIRLMEVETGKVQVGSAEIEAGKEYEVQIYYRNDATEKYNSKEHERVGVAREVSLSTTYSSQIDAGAKGEITARIAAENTSPLWVQSSFVLEAKDDMTLHYVAASAKVQNEWKSNGSVLSRALFSEDGTLLGMDELNGMIFGGEKYGGKVVYRLKTIAANDKAFNKDDPNNRNITPVLPRELPKTGPVEWIFGAIIVILLVSVVFYAGYTKRTKKKTTRRKKRR